MIIPDVNVLVYAHDAESPRQERAIAWWEAAVEGAEPVGLPWAVILGFARVVTHRGIFKKPVSIAAAADRVQEWLDHPNVHVITPGRGHAAMVFKLLEEAGAAGNLTPDAHLAALAIEYKAELVSTDTDFARFPGLRWVNPLARSKKPRKGRKAGR